MTTTTDKELLELAAKAAGIEIDNNGQFSFPNGLWSPLTDDGDALRLAVKLTLEVDICFTGIAVRTPIGQKILVDSDEKPDVYEATRFAIVRAAAEVGKHYG